MSPCFNEVKVTLNMNEKELSGEIGRTTDVYSFDSLVSLRPFERRLVELDLFGKACPTAPTYGREIIAKISRLALQRITPLNF